VKRLLIPGILLAFLLYACTAISPGISDQGVAAGTEYPQYLPLIASQTPGADIWHPMPGTSWQIQYTGDLDTSLEVQMYDLDLFDTPQSLVEQLHSAGSKVVCYFSAGSWESWRPDAGQFPDSVKGNGLQGWPGEKWLDVRQLDVLGPLMAARLNLAAQTGCDGVDPDNVDGYSNDTGFPLSYQDQLTFNTWLANQAHDRGLAVGLKNDLDQVEDLLPHFEWALNEQCFQYNECNRLLPFIQAGKPVFGIEYQGNPAVFCPMANALNFDVLKKNLELDAWMISCR
jgi:hypothetical protein